MKLSFAGSDELAAQIRQGAKVDVYAAANTRIPDELHSDDLLEQPVEFATNEFVLAVPKDSEIDSIDDLTKEGTTMVIGSESVPIGAYTRETLAKLPPGQEKAILANVRSNEPDVKGIVGKLTQGAADAGFVYVTDVNATGGELKAIELPEDLEPQVTYGAGVVRKAEQPELAQKFVDGLTDGDCADALQRRGLRPGAVMRPGWFPALLVLCLAAALMFLTLPVVAIFVDSSPRRPDLQPGRAGRARRALAEPPHHRRLDRDHPAGGHAGGLPAGHALVPGQGAGGHADRAAAGAPAGGRRHRAAGGGRPVGNPRRRDRGRRHRALARPPPASSWRSPSWPRPSTSARRWPPSRRWTRSLLDASRTLGASEARGFLRVMIPVALPGLAAGTALALGRALGEFGATLMFAGSFQGITQTVPLAIYDRFSTDFDSALALSAVLVAVSAAILLSVKLVRGGEALDLAPR